MSVIISYHIPHIHITHIAPLVVVFGRRPGREIWELPVVVSVRFAQGQRKGRGKGKLAPNAEHCPCLNDSN